MPKLPCVLLVDDDPTANFLNRKLLERLEVADQILVAQDGQQALDLLSTHCQPPTSACPVLILLDVNMPVLNGIQFLEAYQQLPAGQQQAVVLVLTTSANPRDRERLAHLPAAGILSKPLTRPQVEQVLREHFA